MLESYFDSLKAPDFSHPSHELWLREPTEPTAKNRRKKQEEMMQRRRRTGGNEVLTGMLRKTSRTHHPPRACTRAFNTFKSADKSPGQLGVEKHLAPAEASTILLMTSSARKSSGG